MKREVDPVEEAIRRIKAKERRDYREGQERRKRRDQRIRNRYNRTDFSVAPPTRWRAADPR